MGVFKQFNNGFKDGWRRSESESYRKRCKIKEKEMAQRKRVERSLEIIWFLILEGCQTIKLELVL